MRNKKVIIAVTFLLILFCLNMIYFYIYFALLDLNFSWWHVFFIAVSTLSYFLLLNFWRSRIWQLLCAVLISGFFITSLMNFAYYKIFRAFIDFSFSQAGQIDAVMIKHLADFRYLVPVKLSWLTAIILAGIILNSIFYYKFSGRETRQVLFQLSALELMNKRKRRTVKHVLALVVLFCLVNLAAFGVSSYLYNKPRETWWNLKNQVADLGLWGYFYTQVYAQTHIEETNNQIDYLDQARDYYKQLAGMIKKSETSVLPIMKKKPNVLVVQLESVGSWAVENDSSPMPFLKSLMAENLTVPDFHSNSCETNNAEFLVSCGFLPNSFEPVNYSHQKNDFNCLPSILKKAFDYQTYFFHANTPGFWDRNVMLPKWGYDNIYLTPFFRQKEDDTSVYGRALGELAKTDKPFFAFITSFTTHAPHNQELIQYQKEVNGLEIKPFTEKIEPWLLENSELAEDEMRNYFGFLKANDDSLKFLFDQMKTSGLLDKTIVVIYGDHRFYTFESDDEIKNFSEYNRVPFVMVLPDKNKGFLGQVSSQVDIAPTLLNLLEGGEYKSRNNFIGTSLYNKNHSDFAINKCLGQAYFVSRDLIIEGNVRSDVYRVLLDQNNQSEEQQKSLIKLLSGFVGNSDQAIFNDELGKD
jgi:phosphoglycerol transferase MdoB-like AlkP superfamily enzyme